MKVLITSVILSLMMAACCCAFFDTLLPRRCFRSFRSGRTLIPAFWAGFMVIAVTPIPPYIFQPVRVIVIVFLIVMLYYQSGILKSLNASVLFCGIYWVVSTFTVSTFPLFPASWQTTLMSRAEEITECIFLALMLLFRFTCKNRFRSLNRESQARFAFFPLLGLIFIVSIAMTSWDGSPADARAKMAAILSFVVISGCILYFISDLTRKEKEMQQLKLVHERTLSQMNQYRSFQKNYEQQRKYLHDYKNQLDCVQGLLKAGQSEEALTYLAGLTGNIRKSAEYVNTNHAVVNTVLNQKYQTAAEKGITLSITVNDLSSLSMKEEEIVSLLGNLLDNAIEACERLDPASAKVIYFKMVLEDDQLILSTRNPVKEPLLINGCQASPAAPMAGSRIRTRKPDPLRHGIGLLNIDEIIQRYHGTSVLKCENGWFSFSAIL